MFVVLIDLCKTLKFAKMKNLEEHLLKVNNKNTRTSFMVSF